MHTFIYKQSFFRDEADKYLYEVANKSDKYLSYINVLKVINKNHNWLMCLQSLLYDKCFIDS